METEAKLAFKDKESLYALARAEFFRELCSDPQEPGPVLLENSYIDTDDLDISRRGGMIRVRHYSGRDEDRFEFTVKYGGSVTGGLHQRHEWNVQSTDGTFSVESFKRQASADDPDDMLSEVFGTVCDDELNVICSNSFNRTVYNISFGQSSIEACFDSGIISSSDGSRTDEICELELELTDGDITDIRELADLIIDKTGCVPFEDTKYRRTLAIGTGD